MVRKKGFFITFEGTEGGGKSTQIGKADAYLRQKGYSVLLLREPGGTRVSEAIREIILDKRYKEMCQQTELLLYLAARAQLVQEKILPALEKGQVVICDRFEDSSLAYQGYGRNIPLEDIRSVSEQMVRGKLVPDLTFILDIDPELGLKRGGRTDRMELQSMQFHQKVRRGFLDLAKRNPKRYKVVDALQDKDAVAEQIRKELERVFG